MADYHRAADGEPGIDGGLARRQAAHDANAVDEYVAKIQQNGGKIVMPKHAIPGVGYQAYCQDTEGNIFGIHENNPSAQ